MKKATGTVGRWKRSDPPHGLCASVIGGLMSALPANNTVRVWVKYTSVGVPHEMMFRLPSGASDVDASAKAATLGTVLATRLKSTDNLLSARYSPAGSNFSVPISFTPVAGTITGSFWSQDPESVQLSLTGRSFTDGRDVDWQFFNAVPTTTWPSNNRYLPGDAAVIDTFRTNFTTWVNTAVGPSQQVVTIAGSIPTVNSYVNIRANAYWQTQQR